MFYHKQKIIFSKKKTTLLKCVAHECGFVYVFMHKLKSLTTIDSLIWLGGLEVKFRTGVPEVPISNPMSDKDFKLTCLLKSFVVAFVRF